MAIYANENGTIKMLAGGVNSNKVILDLTNPNNYDLTLDEQFSQLANWARWGTQYKEQLGDSVLYFMCHNTFTLPYSCDAVTFYSIHAGIENSREVFNNYTNHIESLSDSRTNSITRSSLYCQAEQDINKLYLKNGQKTFLMEPGKIFGTIKLRIPVLDGVVTTVIDTIRSIYGSYIEFTNKNTIKFYTVYDLGAYQSEGVWYLPTKAQINNTSSQYYEKQITSPTEPRYFIIEADA